MTTPPTATRFGFVLASRIVAGLCVAWLGGVVLVGCTAPSEGRRVNAGSVDAPPRVVYQAAPVDAALSRQAPGWARIAFQVDSRGRVRSPKAVDSSDSVFEQPALDAVKKWRFEPTPSVDESWRYNMVVNVNFPEG